MKLPRISTGLWKSKTFKLSLLAVIAVVCMIGGIIWAVSDARAKQRIDLQTQVATLLGFLDSQGKKVETEKSPAAAHAALDSTKQALRDWKPQGSASILGVNVASAATRQAETAVKSQADKLLRIIDDSKALIDYQEQAKTQVAKLSGSSSKNLERLKQQERLWGSVGSDLRGMQSPERAKVAHGELVKVVGECAADISALVVLYEKQDVAGFNAKKNELDNKIGTLQTLGDQFAKISKEQDAELTGQLHELEHRLEDLTK